MKEYEQIELWGSNIESVVNSLLEYKSKGKLVSCDFNGTILYSDTVTLDKAYKQITGKTKAEFDAEQQKWRDDYDKKEKEHQAKIPQLTIEWIERGKNFVKPDMLDVWNECVPIRLGDLYHGMELGNCEEIITALNNGCTLNKARKIMEKQNHSGMSWSLVRSMVKEFAERGNEFYEFTA